MRELRGEEGEARTLPEALAATPDDAERGFRFIGPRGSMRYLSFAALRAEATQRARRLVGMGSSEGSCVALVADDNMEFVLSFLAVSIAGLVPVPIHPRSRFQDLSAYRQSVAHIVQAASASKLLTTDNLLPNLGSLEGLRLSDGSVLERVFSVEDLERCAPASDELPTTSPSDLCFLQFTSGTVSEPKGVCVTHANLIANARASWGPCPGLERNDKDVAVAWLPLFHDMGLIGFVLGPIICDVPVVLLSTEAFARRPSVWLEALSRYRGTITFAPNFAYDFATKQIRDRDLEGIDLTALRIAGCGAEPINPQVLRAFAARFASVGFAEEALTPTYGMAESTLAVAFHPHNTPMKTEHVCGSELRQGRAVPVGPGSGAVEMVSCGVALPGHSLWVADAEGIPVAERVVGEIVTRGRSVSPGYYDNRASTAKTFRDGTLHTGDLGYMAEGDLYVCGRLKDLIIIRGANFHPQDIERAVARLPGIRRGNVAVFSVPEAGNETLIVVAEGSVRDSETLTGSIGEAVRRAVGVTPSDIVIARPGTLPKTTSGKLQRQKTKTLYQDGLLQRAKEADLSNSVVRGGLAAGSCRSRGIALASSARKLS